MLSTTQGSNAVLGVGNDQKRVGGPLLYQMTSDRLHGLFNSSRVMETSPFL